MRTTAILILICGSVLLAQDREIDPFADASNSTLPAKASTPPKTEDLRPSAADLKLLGEPSLEGRTDADRFPTIRVIWCRTFHPPVSLRAYLTKDGPRLRVARMSGKGGYDWGTLDFENDFPLRAETWMRLLNLLNADGARQPLKNVKQEDMDYLTGLDGSTWKLEVSDQAGYTVDEVWTPMNVTNGDPDIKKLAEDQGIRLDNFVKLCSLLIQYAPIDPESIY
ncbi:MAG TPA: hypothetical protein PK490_16245 [Prosthecobacter sp.]|nr:hypothetical protein [Prosthecobacter sp.]HRK15835.1 hypothetical protein [Prosthecobacter sp.]